MATQRADLVEVLIFEGYKLKDAERVADEMMKKYPNEIDTFITKCREHRKRSLQ